MKGKNVIRENIKFDDFTKAHSQTIDSKTTRHSSFKREDSDLNRKSSLNKKNKINNINKPENNENNENVKINENIIKINYNKLEEKKKLI